MANPTISTFARLALKTLPSTSVRLDYRDFSPGVTGVKADANMNRGELDRAVNRTRTTAVMCQPRYAGEPTALEWSYLLPWITGGTPTGSPLVTYPLGNTPVERKLYFDDGNGKIHVMNNVAIRSATLSTANPERLLACSLSMVAAQLASSGSGSTTPAYQDTPGSDPFPSVTLDDTTPPFCLPDASGFTSLGGTTTGTITVDGTVTTLGDFSITMDNVVPDRMFHSFYQTRNIKPDRITQVSFAYPEGEFPALYTDAEDGVPVFIRMVTGGYIFEIEMPAVIFPREPMEFQNRSEVVNRINGIAYKTDASASVILRLDTTA
jgi:hypothetical protein